MKLQKTGNCVLYTVKLRVEARVTIQKIKSLWVLQTETCHKQDMLLFKNSKNLDFEVAVGNMPYTVV